MKQIVLGICSAIVLSLCLGAGLRADTLTANQSMGTGGSLTGGSCTFNMGYAGYVAGGSYILQTDCTDWNSYLDASFHSTYGGYGTHMMQSNSVAVDSGGYLYMGSDGNLVLYNSSVAAAWYTSTGGNSGAYFNVQSDGNLVVYTSGNAPLWSTF